MAVMTWRERWHEIQLRPPVRTALFIVGWLLILLSPAVGAIPGPGGLFVFAFGLGLVLKYSRWAKRRYVWFKRRWPRHGAWADWGLRRRSARRRADIAARSGD